MPSAESGRRWRGASARFVLRTSQPKSSEYSRVASERAAPYDSSSLRGHAIVSPSTESSRWRRASASRHGSSRSIWAAASSAALRTSVTVGAAWQLPSSSPSNRTSPRCSTAASISQRWPTVSSPSRPMAAAPRSVEAHAAALCEGWGRGESS